MRVSAKTTLVIFCVCFVPAVARADVGLPLVAVFLPPLWLALVPIIFIEAAVLRRLTLAPFSRTLSSALLGNILSTFIGVPIAWLALATLEAVCCSSAKGLGTLGAKLYAVTVQAPWLIPYEDQFWWMVPVALVVFAIPCFVVSVLIEAPINRALLRVELPRLAWRATAIANLASYVAVGLLIWPTSKLPDPFQARFQPVLEWFAETIFRFAKALSGH